MQPLLILNNQWAVDNFTLDMSLGDEENDFELTLRTGDLKIRPALGYSFGNFEVAIDGTEYGGYTDTIEVSTETNEAKVTGRTWQGVLAGKIIQPPPGKDYYTASGDLNAIIAGVLLSVDMAVWFKAVPEPCGISATSYQFARYTDAWNGLRKLCRDNGARLAMRYEEKTLRIWAEPLGDTPMLDSAKASFVMSRTFPCTNHLIGLGSGDLSEREVVHAWADEYGNVTVTDDQGYRLWNGPYEVAETYENTGGDSLAEDTKEQLESKQELGSISMKVSEDSDIYGIDQILSARNNDFGAIEVTARVSQKVVNIKNGAVTVAYEVADTVVKEGDN